MERIDQLRELISLENGLSVVSVARPSGGVQSSVVNAGVLDHPKTRKPVVGLVAAGRSAKLTLLRRNPLATVTVRVAWRWIAVEGRVDLVGPDDGFPGFDAERVRILLREIFTSAGGTHDDWDEYDRVMADERRCCVLVHPERVYGVA